MPDGPGGGRFPARKSVPGDRYWGSGEYRAGAGRMVPPVLTAPAHPAVADNRDGLPRAWDAVHLVDRGEREVCGFCNAGADGAKPVPNRQEFFVH